MICVFVTFIRVIYGTMIYMSVPVWERAIHSVYRACLSLTAVSL